MSLSSSSRILICASSCIHVAVHTTKPVLSRIFILLHSFCSKARFCLTDNPVLPLTGHLVKGVLHVLEFLFQNLDLCVLHVAAHVTELGPCVHLPLDFINIHHLAGDLALEVYKWQWKENKLCHFYFPDSTPKEVNQSTHKEVNQSSTYVTPVQQQKPELPTVTLTWHACKYKVRKLLQRHILGLGALFCFWFFLKLPTPSVFEGQLLMVEFIWLLCVPCSRAFVFLILKEKRIQPSSAMPAYVYRTRLCLPDNTVGKDFTFLIKITGQCSVFWNQWTRELISAQNT